MKTIRELEHFQKYCSHLEGKENDAVFLGFGVVSAQSQGSLNLLLRRSLAKVRAGLATKILAANGYRIFSNALMRFSPLLLALALGSGCATKALWDGNAFEDWNEPASEPNLRLYEGGKQADVLVVYDEYSERSDATHTRAYWMNQNEKRLEQRRMPYFVNTNTALHLSAVPVFGQYPEGTSIPPIYALLETNRQSFTLYSHTEPQTSHDLPTYNDGKGKIEKVVLTPPVVTADLTIIGGFLGYFCLEGFAQSGGSITFH